MLKDKCFFVVQKCNAIGHAQAKTTLLLSIDMHHAADLATAPLLMGVCHVVCVTHHGAYVPSWRGQQGTVPFLSR